MKRPLRVTLIAWFGIVVGLLTVASTIVVAFSIVSGDQLVQSMLEAWRLPVGWQIARGLLVGTALLVAGAFMLGRRRWARELMIAALAVGLVVYLYDSPYLRGGFGWLPLVQIGFFLLLIGLLISPKSRRWFVGDEPVPREHGTGKDV